MEKVYNKYAAGKSMRTIHEVDNDHEINNESDIDKTSFEFNRQNIDQQFREQINDCLGDMQKLSSVPTL